MNIFKNPIVAAILGVAVVVALGWTYYDNWQDEKAQQEARRIAEEQREEARANLTNVDPNDFVEVLEEEYLLATRKAEENDPKNELAALVVELPGLEVNSGNNRYIYTSESDNTNNWTITISQETRSYIRADIPKDDYMGDLMKINSDLWQFNYVTALQIAERAGGLTWREANDLKGITLTLRHAGPNDWLMWNVEYQGEKNKKFEVDINAKSGDLIES